MSGCIVNCTNHGSCVFDSASNTYSCACSVFFTGKACQTDTRACSSSPCLNNATCVDIFSNSTTNSSSIGGSGFSCDCQKGYEGVYCESKINVCANETCSGNGNCVDMNNLPKCKCFSMYEGEKCSIQSSELNTIKSLISMSSIIAIVVITCFYLMILIMDLMDCYTEKSKRRQVRKNGIVRKFIYIN
jgi:hypothetical protein